MKHLKKSLSLFLCIVLSLSLFPVPAAYAEEAGSEETEHVSAINVFEQVIDEFDENSSSDIEDPDPEEQPVLQNDTIMVP